MTWFFFDAKSLEIWDLADMGRGSAAALRGNGGRFFGGRDFTQSSLRGSAEARRGGWAVRLRFFVAESSG
jgi:hypothetical protein